MMLYYLQGVLAVLGESISLVIVLNTIARKKTPWHPLLFSGTVIITTWIGVWLIVQLFVDEPVLRSILATAFIVLLSRIFYQSEPGIRVYFITLHFILLTTIDYIYISALFSFEELGWARNMEMWLFGITLLSKLSAIAFVYFMCTKVLVRLNLRFMPTKGPWILPIGLMAINIFVFLQLIVEPPYGQGLELVSRSITLIVLNVLIFYYTYLADKNARNEMREALLEQRIELLSQNMETTTSVHEQQRSFMHDYNNQLTTIIYLYDLDPEEGKKYVAGLLDNLQDGSYIYNTGNTIVDAVLNVKHAVCREKHIDVDAREITGLNNELPIAKTDLAGVLSNLLDNAIEASEKLEEDRRYIKVKLACDKNTLTIAIKNRVGQKVAIVNNSIESTKPEPQNHGIGLQIVFRSLAKYGAKPEMIADDQWFQFISIIQL